MTGLPSYAELAPAPHGGRSAWGLFGADDNADDNLAWST